MRNFIREFVDLENNVKSALGAITMSLFLVYENQGHPFDMYTIALCGQFFYSLLLGNFWMSSYQTLKKKQPQPWWWRGLISTFITASFAGLATGVVQTILMNPEAIATAWWAFRLSTFAFLFNEGLCWWRRHKKNT